MKQETPVIFRLTKEGIIIALLPTIPLEGISTAIIAYSIEHGWFTSDTSIMHSTSDCETANTWPILIKLVKEEGIMPIRVYKRIMGWMDTIRLDKSIEPLYKAVA